MTASLLKRLPELLKNNPPTTSAITNDDVLLYLRTSRQWPTIQAAATREALILQLCRQLDITVTDEDLQAAGDAFRQKHRLTTAAQTLEWLQENQLSVEDWTEGIRRQLLTRSLQIQLFAESVDNHYVQNRAEYQRIALSQIIVATEAEASALLPTLRQNPERFGAIALETSIAKNVQQNAGFMGIVYGSALAPVVAEAITPLAEGDISEPVATRKGIHLFKLEKRFPTELSSEVRNEIMALLLDNWLMTLLKTESSKK